MDLKTAPAAPQAAPTTESLVEEWSAAYAAEDVDKAFSLWSDDAEWMDNADPEFQSSGPQKVKDIESMIRGSVGSFQVHITSHFISADGRFAAAQGTFAMNVKTAPAVAILEFKDGKIVKETWYYDGSQFFH